MWLSFFFFLLLPLLSLFGLFFAHLIHFADIFGQGLPPILSIFHSNQNVGHLRQRQVLASQFPFQKLVQWQSIASNFFLLSFQVRQRFGKALVNKSAHYIVAVGFPLFHALVGVWTQVDKFVARQVIEIRFLHRSNVTASFVQIAYGFSHDPIAQRICRQIGKPDAEWVAFVCLCQRNAIGNLKAQIAQFTCVHVLIVRKVEHKLGTRQLGIDQSIRTILAKIVSLSMYEHGVFPQPVQRTSLAVKVNASAERFTFGFEKMDLLGWIQSIQSLSLLFVQLNGLRLDESLDVIGKSLQLFSSFGLFFLGLLVDFDLQESSIVGVVRVKIVDNTARWWSLLWFGIRFRFDRCHRRIRLTPIESCWNDFILNEKTRNQTSKHLLNSLW